MGCGFAAYKIKETPFKSEELFVCNYGPSGNIVDIEMYKSRNTNETLQCSENSTPSLNYTSLCQATDERGPLEPNVTSEVLFSCAFEDEQNCNISITSKNSNSTFEKRTVVDGKYLSFELNETEQVSLDFPGQFSSPNGFCFQIIQRKGAAVAGEESSNELKAKMVIPEVKWSTTADFGVDASEWVQANMDIKWDMRTNITLEFSALANSTRQYFDLKKVVVYAGSCLD